MKIFFILTCGLLVKNNYKLVTKNHHKGHLIYKNIFSDIYVTYVRKLLNRFMIIFLDYNFFHLKFTTLASFIW